jgi:Lon protease-like protein
MTESIRVNFARPMALFPLPDAVLLPHAVQPLQIFEPRYRQMVNDCLDSSGQMAMATFEGRIWRSPEHRAQPRLRPAVCVGQIVRHEPLPGGRQLIILQGVCRARITTMQEPGEGRLYRMAQLTPTERVQDDPPAMTDVRLELRDLLHRPRLRRVRSVDSVIDWFDRDDISTHALLELVGFALVRDTEVRYRLLAEPDPLARAAIIRRELRGLDSLIALADRQGFRRWPKGVSWN